MNTKPSGKPFRCRICQATEFVPLQTEEVLLCLGTKRQPGSYGITTDQVLIAFECTGCSLLFADPETFSL